MGARTLPPCSCDHDREDENSPGPETGIETGQAGEHGEGGGALGKAPLSRERVEMKSMATSYNYSTAQRGCPGLLGRLAASSTCPSNSLGDSIARVVLIKSRTFRGCVSPARTC